MQCEGGREAQLRTVTSSIDALPRYLANAYAKELGGILEHPDLEKHFGVEINCTDLAHEHIDVVADLISNPQSIMPIIDASLRQAQHNLASSADANATVKGFVHARLHGLPYFMDTVAEDVSPQPSSIGACHKDKLLTVAGSIVRAQSVQLFEAYRIVQCVQCCTPLRLQVCVSNPSNVEVPSECPNPACHSTGFKPVDCDAVGYTNFQEVCIQDHDSSQARSRLPHGFPVILLHDLVDSCQVGDRVEITGVLMQQAQGQVPGNGSIASLRLVLVACHVQKAAHTEPMPQVPQGHQFEEFWQEHAAHPFAGRARIVNSVCPRLCNVFDVKLALLLLLLGGVSVAHEACSTRAQPHLLLIGDPGTGKSQIMKAAAKLAPRAVATTGRGTTHTGLTAAAVKEGKQWTLQAGAMPLADGGICCIDEFGDVPAAERCALLEAMEQQTISVAKAGMVTKLSARTSVLAAMNPVRQYEPNKPLEANTGLPSPLLSRFDMVLVMLDGVNSTRDAAVADHILQLDDHSSCQPNVSTSSSALSAAQGASESTAVWTTGQVRDYIAWARRTFQPSMTPAAQALLQAYFQKQRALASLDGRPGQDRVTVRMLEGMARLATAHARLLARHCVTQQDALAVLQLMERCANTVAVLPLGSGGGSDLCRCELDDAAHAAAAQRMLEALEIEGGAVAEGHEGLRNTLRLCESMSGAATARSGSAWVGQDELAGKRKAVSALAPQWGGDWGRHGGLAKRAPSVPAMGIQAWRTQDGARQNSHSIAPAPAGGPEQGLQGCVETRCSSSAVGPEEPMVRLPGVQLEGSGGGGAAAVCAGQRHDRATGGGTTAAALTEQHSAGTLTGIGRACMSVPARAALDQQSMHNCASAEGKACLEERALRDLNGTALQWLQGSRDVAVASVNAGDGVVGALQSGGATVMPLMRASAPVFRFPEEDQEDIDLSDVL